MSNGPDRHSDKQKDAATPKGTQESDGRAQSGSEMRPKENDARKSDGVATFKALESDKERHHRQSD